MKKREQLIGFRCDIALIESQDRAASNYEFFPHTLKMIKKAMSS